MVAEVTVGSLPDMLIFTKDCSTVLTADEGEAGGDENDVFINPEGSVSIVDVSKALANEDVWHLCNCTGLPLLCRLLSFVLCACMATSCQ